jgi:hypothetical protein
LSDSGEQVWPNFNHVGKIRRDKWQDPVRFDRILAILAKSSWLLTMAGIWSAGFGNGDRMSLDSGGWMLPNYSSG